MELTILGSGSCAPSPTRGCSGFLLRGDGKTILLDCGPGSFRQLANHGVEFGSIDHILISHFHIDHVGDLAAILFSQKHCCGGKREENTIIHGPKGFAKDFGGLMNAFGTQITDDDYSFELHEYGNSSGVKEFDGFTVTALPVIHPLPTVGYRLKFSDSGKVVAYSGDTSVSENVVTLGHNADCLIIECAATEDKPLKGHTSASEAGSMAEAAGARLLILSHITPETDRTDVAAIAAKTFGGKVLKAEDSLKVEL